MPSTVRDESESDSGKNGVSICYETPKWVTAELFENSLKTTVPNYQIIKHFEANPALAAGENFTTIILRVRIDAELADGTTKSLSYVMKLPTDNENFIAMTRIHNIFKVEYKMYNDILPEFEQLYRNRGTEARFSPKWYSLETPSEFEVILLEDLLPSGYENANRLEGLNLEHTKAVLQRIAQWHAVSAARVESKGLYPEMFLRGSFAESERAMLNFFYASIKPQVVAIAKTFKGHETYIESLTKTLDNMADRVLRALKYDPSEFNVLNHGDCWSNNVMFKYDSEGEIEDTLLIDYQCVSYGSPVRDLFYFLMSSTSYDVKVKHFDYLIQFYHDHLVKNLKLLKYPKKMPTLKEIHMAILKYGILGLSTSLTIMGAALMESRSDANIDVLIGNTEDAVNFRNAILANPRYQKHLEILLPWMSNRGTFEMEI